MIKATCQGCRTVFGNREEVKNIVKVIFHPQWGMTEKFVRRLELCDNCARKLEEAVDKLERGYFTPASQDVQEYYKDESDDEDSEIDKTPNRS